MEPLFRDYPDMTAAYIIEPMLCMIVDRIHIWSIATHNVVCKAHKDIQWTIERVMFSAAALIRVRLISPVMALAMEHNAYWRLVRDPFCRAMEDPMRKQTRERECWGYVQCAIKMASRMLSRFLNMRGEDGSIFLCFLNCLATEEKKLLPKVSVNNNLRNYTEGNRLGELARVADSYYGTLRDLVKQYSKEGQEEEVKEVEWAHGRPRIAPHWTTMLDVVDQRTMPPEDWFLLASTWDTVVGMRNEIALYRDLVGKQKKLDATIEFIESKKKVLWRQVARKRRQERVAATKRAAAAAAASSSSTSQKEEKDPSPRAKKKPRLKKGQTA